MCPQAKKERYTTGQLQDRSAYVSAEVWKQPPTELMIALFRIPNEERVRKGLPVLRFPRRSSPEVDALPALSTMARV